MSRRKILTTFGKLSTLNNGLLSYYKLNGNSNDSVGALNGTDTSISYSTGKIGNAAIFSGSPSKIKLGNVAINSVSQYTLSAWVYTNNAPSTSDAFFYKWVVFTQGSLLIRLSAAGEIQWFICVSLTDVATTYIMTSGAGFTQGSWHHICAVFDGTLTGSTNRARIYLDGVLKTSTATGTIPATTTSGNADLLLGTFTGAGQHLNGKMDEVGVWNRALTGAEVTELYNLGAGKTQPF